MIVAGVELTLPDCVRYYYKAAGINGVAQIVKDIGTKTQAAALQAFVKHARTALPLDPSVRPLVQALAQAGERNPRWKLLINGAVEVAE